MGLERGQLAKPLSTDRLEMMLIVRGKQTEDLASSVPPLTKGMSASSWVNLQFRCAAGTGLCLCLSWNLIQAAATRRTAAVSQILGNSVHKETMLQWLIALETMLQQLIVSNHLGFSKYLGNPCVSVDFKISS